MKLFRNLVLFIGFLLINKIVNAQDLPFGGGKSDSPSFSVPYQYGNIPVNLTTGAISINIPLWNATSGSLSVPISASYSSNGIRSSDVPSELGLHWSLNAGGSIMQIVRSKDNKGVPENQASLLNPTYSFMYSVNEGHVDSEPDIYIVNAPGLNVKFMLAEDNHFINLTESDIKIENVSEEYLFRGFIITTSKGVKYYFDESKVTTYKQGEGIDAKYTYTRLWLLTKIENANKTNTIRLSYTDLDSMGDFYELCYGKNYTGKSVFNGTETIDSAITFTYQKMIKKIETENEIIYFNNFTPNDYTSHYPRYVNDEAPDKNHGVVYYNNIERFIHNIIIKNKKDEIVKTFDFNYFINNSNRVFLNEITEKDNLGISLPNYSFEYIQPNNTGEVFNSHRDFWGYYNPNASNMFPESNIAIGLIDKVNYPVGGFTKYFYEPNTYCFGVNNEDVWYSEQWKEILNNNGLYVFPYIKNLRAGGFRINKIENHSDSIVSSKIFDYGIVIEEGDTISSGRLTSYPINNYSYYFYSQDGLDSTRTSISSSNQYNVEEGYVTYEKITVYEDEKIDLSLENKAGKYGKTEFVYELPTPEYNDSITFPYSISTFPQNEEGLLKSKTIYDNENLKISQQLTNFNISKDTSNMRYGLKVVPKSPNDFYRGLYAIKPISIKLNNNKSYTFPTTNNGNSIENNVQYSYTRNNIERKYPTEIIKTNSKGDIIKTEMYYPNDDCYNGIPEIELMRERNILSPTIKTESFKNGERFSGEKTTFGFHITANNDTLIVPISSEILEEDVYKTVNWFDKYDDFGNLIESHGLDNIHNCVIYGYNNTLVVATILNANYTQINAILTNDDWNTINNPQTDVELNNVINKLRTQLTNAYVVTKTYKPLIGKTSETDANGISVYYEYDSFGRLIKVFDQDGNLINKTDYHIKE